jgi:hypothetical protein
MTISNRPKPARTRERERVIEEWLARQARKKRHRNLDPHGMASTIPPPPSVGSASGAPVWIRAVTKREGQNLVTQCCIVAAGDIHPFTISVNLSALAAQVKRLQAAGILREPQAAGRATVSGFGSFLGKLAHGITHNAVTKAVGKVVTKVVRSPIVQIANPMMAITAHTISKAATGKGTIKGRLGTAVDLGTSVVVPHGLAHVGPQALGALGIGAKAVMASQAGATIRAVAKDAQHVVAQGKQAAALLQTGRLTAAAAAPLIEKAVNVRASVSKLAPKLAVNVGNAKKVQAAIARVASRAKAGSPEARKAAVTIASAAKMIDKISAAEQAVGGGNAGFVVTAQGKIRRAPKGKFVRTAALPAIETLYRGASLPPLRGSFSAVSGHAAWGGDRDPGDDTDGPFTPARYNDPTAWPQEPLDPDHSSDPIAAYEHSIEGVGWTGIGESPWYQAGSGPNFVGNTRNFLGLVAGPPTSHIKLHGWKGAPGTSAAARDRAKSLLELARARHHLQKTLKRTKVGNMASLMVGADLIVGDGAEDVGTPPEMTEHADGLPNVDLLVSGEPWGVGAEGIHSVFGTSLMVSGRSGFGTNELIGCGEPNVGGVPWYVFTAKNLRHPVVQRRFLAGLKAMPPKMRRRVLSRLSRAINVARHTKAYRNYISGAIRSANATVGSHRGPGWAAVSGIPGGYELVGSHRQPGILTP